MDGGESIKTGGLAYVAETLNKYRLTASASMKSSFGVN